MLTKFFRKSVWKSLIRPISSCKKVYNWKTKTNTPPCDPNHYRALAGQTALAHENNIRHCTSRGSLYVVVAQIPLRRPTSRQPKAFSAMWIVLFFSQPLLHSGGSKSAHGLLRRRLCPNDQISTSARIFLFGSTPISWRSWKQSSTSHSSCEAKYRFLQAARERRFGFKG